MGFVEEKALEEDEQERGSMKTGRRFALGLTLFNAALGLCWVWCLLQQLWLVSGRI
jgi:hypothetical protein